MSARTRTVLIVQMRLDSTRLPRKALLAFAGATLAEAVMRRLRLIAADEYVLASDRDGIAALGETAKSCGFSSFAGPKDDVLARYAQAAASFDASVIIRATGDNPLVSYELGNALRERFLDSDADYAGYIGMPSGMGVELIRSSALRKAHREALSDYDREHVCPYLYANPGVFAIDRPLCPPSHRLEGASLTVDTPFDYERMLKIAAELGCSPLAGLPNDAELLAWLKRERDYATDGTK
jgi:spore coat polysaccharide biosynthesis protein SpsF